MPISAPHLNAYHVEPPTKRAKVANPDTPTLTTLPKDVVANIFNFITFSNASDTRRAAQAGLLIRDLREGFSQSVDIADIHSYLALIQDCMTINRNTNPLHLRGRFEDQTLPYIHKNKVLQNLAKFVDIKRRVLDINRLRQSVQDIPYARNLEHAILDSESSFNHDTQNLIQTRLTNNNFFNSPGVHFPADGVFIADRLVDLVGDAAARYLEDHFEHCDDMKLLEFTADPSFYKHEAAKSIILEKLQQHTLGQGSPLGHTPFWKKAIELILSLGEPARQFALNTCHAVNHRELAYYAVKSNEQLDPTISQRCQQLVTDRLNLDTFNAGFESHDIVQRLSQVPMFQASAEAYLARRPINVNFRIFRRQDEEQINAYLSFQRDVERLAQPNPAGQNNAGPWHHLLTHQLLG